MAFNAYLKLTGTKQGTIKGSGTKGKQTGGIEIQEFSFGLESPLDSQSGQATGGRQHKPVVIVREVDVASPLLFQALCSNETFTSATLSFVRPDASGKLPVISTVELTNATIFSITHAPSSGGKRRERIFFDYEQVLVNGLSNVAIPHSL
jgi:type VI secretion system secreted protein Hcp